MPWRNDRSFNPGSYNRNSPSLTERVVCILCYITSGIAGIIYIIITRSQSQSEFFRFHFLQSIVLGIISLLLSWALQAAAVALGPIISALLEALSGAGIVIGTVTQVLSLFMGIFMLLPLYGAIMAGLGKYAQIPLISDVVRNQMR